MKVLLIEDERDLADAVTAILQKNNFSVDNAYDGEYGLDCALSDIYDFIILDIMLPKKDGLRVLKEMRSAGIKTPVLMLTAKGELREKVAGLDSGADDYLPKPFHIDELLARLRALGRRKGELNVDGVIQIKSLSFNPQTLTLTKNSNETKLTLKESQLLELLISRKGNKQVRKVLLTLLDNAVKYTPVSGEITATLTKEKRHIVCTVKNSGDGIQPEDLPNVFDRFYRGDPARSSENNGYGLGLAIAKAISDQLNITITADSKEGEYTEFRLVIPDKPANR